MYTEAKKRIAVIDYDQCHPRKCGGWYCEQVCPVNRSGTECIVHEDEKQPNIIEETCIGCLICVKKCPFDAISVVNLSIDPGDPLHQFDKNQFRLHGFPLPRNNEVVGIIGQNGIGKTTALKILSGRLVPNLGKYDQPATWDAVAEKYRGKEAFAIFDQLHQNKLSVAFKPQQVDKLPQSEKGKVKELLSKVDETNGYDAVIQTLGLENILERTLDQLSGGELQKIAIAATALRNADVYFFDEPSSFLDISQRMGIAQFIRNLAQTGKSVIVVEHDLILLDYLSDKVHLMYGKPSVFGIVSQIKNSREGINEYLEGYSREENYRFRDHSIEFFGKSAKNDKTAKPLFSYPALKKTLGAFSLDIEAGSLNRHEVIGVLGPNGIGKTTFVKILAGQLDADNQKLEQKLSIAYKPQYIQPPEEEQTVEELISKETKGADLETLKRTLFGPLDVLGLWPKNVNHLSGGELQRLAIGLTLAKDSQLILLDEPSAYLDVEQRIKIAKTIRSTTEQSGKTCLVVDHDLMFIDYLSDRLMVFDGTPAVHGTCRGPFTMEAGMNKLLSKMQITLRRDHATRRPRINKHGSQLDSEQKQSGKYYYT
ncbi:MAG: ribosome biogenesis/translation initiation ATPase RLI [Candidatus Diapherotrites archaeon]|uniref:Ribosome biogenesis/translation initiation ATPase RLI n=1 Tax=Candidatus Iainarchaeum sp. TaxID=3101447 RepID=A0A8T4L8X0_9ARCH|nr:ribosome biogenesis/translation initiation ATPase RLI [Candidatus Diapherotrites archaeon]